MDTGLKQSSKSAQTGNDPLLQNPRGEETDSFLQQWQNRFSFKQHPLEYIILGISLLVILIFAVMIDGFFTWGNLSIIARNATALTILGCGMAVVIISRGLDLSQISVMVAVSAVFGLLLTAGADYMIALLAAFLLAIVLGALNGWLIAYIEIPALMSTLATAMLIAGFCRWGFLQGEFLVLIPKELPEVIFFSTGKLSVFPVSVIIGIVVLIATYVLLSQTVLGRMVYAMGDNYISARLTGLSVRTATVFIYIFSAITACIAGIIVSSGSGTVDFRIVTNGTLLFEVIMVVVLGGIRLRGGRGGVFNLLIGVILISVLHNGMTLMNLSGQVQNLVKGLILISAIVIDNYINPRDAETDTQGDL
ncbi:MAG: ABC transporter permease [Sneathiella sp.]|jgi:ribose transport system permease protein|uniref:ABC transporter permease n=1 Tax=Sneathiella sp. TaxID=1964365 RepID=UPI000C5B01F3|nr:ABC transporter permease [Sneathiella sp.]MAL77767.1 ABC transporter permease [Sneathiella sp.]|tara:strand:+ start:198 stop:1289 length:1092 start_codon:yes stop_codon:yes gene_type:complete